MISGPKSCEDNKRSTTMKPTTASPKPKSCDCGRSYKKTSAKARIWNGQEEDPIRDPWMIFIMAKYVWKIPFCCILYLIVILFTLTVHEWYFSIFYNLWWITNFQETYHFCSTLLSALLSGTWVLWVWCIVWFLHGGFLFFLTLYLYTKINLLVNFLPTVVCFELMKLNKIHFHILYNFDHLQCIIL